VPIATLEQNIKSSERATRDNENKTKIKKSFLTSIGDFLYKSDSTTVINVMLTICRTDPLAKSGQANDANNKDIMYTNMIHAVKIGELTSLFTIKASKDISKI
jgi:hypothetical protein